MSLLRFKAFLRKINTVFYKQKSSEKNYEKFTKIGLNSSINHLLISVPENSNNSNMIQIGKDCILSGNIVMHSKDATVEIGDRVFIGPNTTLFCYKSIVIEADVMISWGCTIIDTNAHSLKSKDRLNDVLDWKKGEIHKNWAAVISKPILIKKSSWIGFNSIITKGVTVEEGTVLAAGSVLTKSTNSYTIYGGNPAKIIKKTE